MRGARRSLKPRPMAKVDPRKYATQSAYRKVDAFLGRLVDAWRVGSIAWSDVREGVVAVADIAQEEFSVPVRAMMLPDSGGYKVVVQVGAEGVLLLSAVRTFPPIPNEPKPSESEYRTRRFKPLSAWHNCEPEVDG